MESESLIRQKKWSAGSWERRKLSPTVKGRREDLWGSRANNKELWATSSKTNVKKKMKMYFCCAGCDKRSAVLRLRGENWALWKRTTRQLGSLDSWKHEQTMLSQVRATGLAAPSRNGPWPVSSLLEGTRLQKGKIRGNDNGKLSQWHWFL